MTTTSAPPTIQFNQIILRDRVRSQYNNIDSLADSIATVGLLCPIILSPLPDGTFLLEDGGRRHRALESLGVTEVFHATTGQPGRPGYVLKSEVSTPEGSKLTELIANLHREDLDWRDEVKLLVQAYRLRKQQADLDGEKLYYSTFGKMVGNYTHTDINAAVQIHDELVAHPEKFAGFNTLLQAYGGMIKETTRVLEGLMVNTRAQPSPTVGEYAVSLVDGIINTMEGKTEPVVPVIALAPFRLGNSLDWMERERPMFDHIICDPDFAIAPEVLDSQNTGSAQGGVIQESIEHSLDDLGRLIKLAYNCCRSYFVFFYDLDHHEKLQRCCKEFDWLVQRWPITWFKTDHRSNGAPQHNFTKNVEWAMVCRKPSATLATPAPSSVIALPSGETTKQFGHPFAKPVDLWTRIYSAVCHKGQSVFDPFMGSGSSTIAAIRYGLAPSGMELNPDHYHRAILNVQEEYRRQLGGEVRFE